MSNQRDHGGGLDEAVAKFGGVRNDWIDLSTGINPIPFPIPDIPEECWTGLPDRDAVTELQDCARAFWSVPSELDIVVASGASAVIAALPKVLKGKTASIPMPTYNEHSAAFEANQWLVSSNNPDVKVIVHPNNPDGNLWEPDQIDAPQLVVDESFCDICPDRSFIHQSPFKPETVILKSFGKFWGLAGLRLGFAICSRETATDLRNQLGPWAVSGPACYIGSKALRDQAWAIETRKRLSVASNRLIELLTSAGLKHVGGTDLFSLVTAPDARAIFDELCERNILARIFPYSENWLRFGLPGSEDEWLRLEAALEQMK